MSEKRSALMSWGLPVTLADHIGYGHGGYGSPVADIIKRAAELARMRTNEPQFIPMFIQDVVSGCGLCPEDVADNAVAHSLCTWCQIAVCDRCCRTRRFRCPCEYQEWRDSKCVRAAPRF